MFYIFFSSKVRKLDWATYIFHINIVRSIFCYWSNCFGRGDTPCKADNPPNSTNPRQGNTYMYCLFHIGLSNAFQQYLFITSYL